MLIVGGNSFLGIRLFDEDMEIIPAKEWDDDPNGEWSEIQSIPRDKKIIGLKVNTENEMYGVLYYISFILGPEF